MKVPRDRKGLVAVRFGERRTWLVDKVKRRLIVRAKNRVDPEAGREPSHRSIVVASHEKDLRFLELPAGRGELVKHLSRASASSVKKVAEHEEPSCPCCRDQHCEPRKILLGRTFRHWNASVSKRRGLAEVQVGNQQRLGRRQERRPSRHDHDVGIGGFGG
jgi:hypothetical protein